jgi:serine/threonine-protein kinase
VGAAGLAGAAGASTNPGTAGFDRTMPPLQGPPVDDDPYGAPRHPLDDEDEPERRRTWAWLVAGLVLLAVLGTGAWLLLSGNGDDANTASPTTTSAAPVTTSAAATTSAAPDTVYVDTSSYIGEDADRIAGRLQELGLQVDQQEASDAQLAAVGTRLDENAVVTTDPANATVTRGSTVTLFFTADAYRPDDGSGDSGGDSGTGGDDGGGQQTTTAPRTTVPTTTNAAPTTTTSSVPTTTTSSPASTSNAGGEPAPSVTLPPDASADTGAAGTPGTTG